MLQLVPIRQSILQLNHVYLAFCSPVNWLTLGHFGLTEAMGTHIQVSAWTHSFISFGGQEGAKLLCNLESPCLSLLRASRWFSKVTRPPSPLPPVTYVGSGFSIPSATLAAISVSSESHILMGWAVPHCGLICISLVANDTTEHPFMCPSATSIFEVMWHFLCPFSSLAICAGFSACKISFVFSSYTFHMWFANISLSLWSFIFRAGFAIAWETHC